MAEVFCAVRMRLDPLQGLVCTAIENDRTVEIIPLDCDLQLGDQVILNTPDMQMALEPDTEYFAWMRIGRQRRFDADTIEPYFPGHIPVPQMGAGDQE